MSKKKILIYGAGAIGRGYVPWLFDLEKTELSYVETDKVLRRLLIERGGFTSYLTKDKKYKELYCPVKNCFDLGEEDPASFDGIITAVGPRQVFSLKDTLKEADCPILLFENDSTLPEKLATLTNKKNFFFGIPDVITSSSAPEELKAIDPLSIVTEDGICFVDKRAKEISGDISYVNNQELMKQWTAKLYLHNTPHCIAAYLGAIKQNIYLHEGMKEKNIYSIVKGAMEEMGETIKVLFNIDEEFIDWYSQKELQRFSNELLFDPISRVAREPFRKLGLSDRLIGAAQLSLSTGKVPKYIMLGIMAAFLYDQENDDDFHIKILMRSLEPKDFLKLIINLNPHEALYKLIIDSWDELKNTLENLK